MVLVLLMDLPQDHLGVYRMRINQVGLRKFWLAIILMPHVSSLHMRPTDLCHLVSTESILHTTVVLWFCTRLKFKLSH